MSGSANPSGSARRLELAARGSSVGIVVIAAAGLAGWIFDVPFLTTWQAPSVPLAPLTTVLLLLLGCSLLLATSMRERDRLAATALASIGALVTFALAIVRLNGSLIPVELMGFTAAPPVADVPVGFISPITAVSQCVINLSLLASLRRSGGNGYLLRGAAAIIAYFGLALVATTLYGAPLLSGVVLIPVSLPASVAMLLSGTALWSLAPSDHPATSAKMLRTFLLVFVLVSAAVFAGGYAYYRDAERTERADIAADLESALSLLTTSVGQWQHERVGDAVVLQEALLGSLAATRVGFPVEAARPVLERVLRSYQGYGEYDRVLLFDAGGTFVMSVPEVGQPASALLVGVRQALRTRQALLQDFYYEPDEAKSYLALVAPLLDNRGAAIGAFVLRVNPDLTLAPSLEHVYGIGPSAEAILVRRDGDAVQYLAHSTVRGAAVGGLGQRVTSRTDVAVRAMSGAAGLFEGISHDGRPVLAMARPVPGTAWHIVVQVDASSLRNRLRRHLQVVTAFIALLLFTTGGGLSVFLRERRLEYYRERSSLVSALEQEITEHRAAEVQLQASEERLQTALASSTRLAQMYATLSQCNAAIVRSKSEEELFPAICEAAVVHGGVSMAAVALGDPQTGRVVPVAGYGEGAGYLDGLEATVHADNPFGRGPIGVSIRENRAVWIDDFSTDVRTAPWKARASQYGWLSAAALPLRRGGRTIGCLVIYASVPGAFDEQSRGLLLELSSNVSFALDALAHDAGRRSAEALAQASLREKEALLREVHHRVKNNLQVISSFLRLEAARSTEGHVRLVLNEMQNRVLSMALLHETLYRSGNMARVDLATYLPRLVAQIFNTYGRSATVSLHLDVDHVSLQLEQAVPFGLIVNELVSNALKHAFPNGVSGEVRVALRPVDGGPAVTLTVADNGTGLPANFEDVRQHSLGLQLVADLTRELHGALECRSESGAVFTVTFTPRTADADPASRPS